MALPGIIGHITPPVVYQGSWISPLILGLGKLIFAIAPAFAPALLNRLPCWSRIWTWLFYRFFGIENACEVESWGRVSWWVDKERLRRTDETCHAANETRPPLRVAVGRVLVWSAIHRVFPDDVVRLSSQCRRYGFDVPSLGSENQESSNRHDNESCVVKIGEYIPLFLSGARASPQQEKVGVDRVQRSIHLAYFRSSRASFVSGKQCGVLTREVQSSAIGR